MKAWKGLALVLCLALTATLVMAGEVKAADPAKGKTHKENAEIVSVDVENKMIVLKDAKGEEHKAPVMGKALESLKMWKAGDKVTVVCQDDEKGEHQGIIAITKAGAAPAAETK
jgi:hypothetical protein